MLYDAERERRCRLVGHEIDKIFTRLGIDPSLASLSAFEVESIAPLQFGEQMIIRRVGQGLSQHALALKTGYNHDTIRRWEQGRTSPPLVAASVWAEALNLELSLRITPRS
jgi:DNA-binding XRE family transcriptional regulator